MCQLSIDCKRAGKVRNLFLRIGVMHSGEDASLKAIQRIKCFMVFFFFFPFS